MSDRLDELRRQRALAQEQVAWFEREIAREEGTPAPAVAVQPDLTAPPDPEADRILAQYRNRGQSIQSEVRRGCFLYFGAAFALLAAGLLLFYLLRRD